MLRQQHIAANPQFCELVVQIIASWPSTPAASSCHFAVDAAATHLEGAVPLNRWGLGAVERLARGIVASAASSAALLRRQMPG
jgi:hypothetical protein